MSFDVTVKCTCGKELEPTNHRPVEAVGVYLSLEVEPCPDCVEKADEEGYDRGVAEAGE